MSMRRMAALQAVLLLVATFASAASKSSLRIKVLDSETRAVSLDNNGVPQNCDQVNFDAYCRSSTSTPLKSTLLVQEGDAPPFRITCTMQSRLSACTPLPIGQTFDGRREKGGITVYYVDEKGKVRKQFYTLVASDAKPTASAPVAAVATPPAPASHTASPTQNSPAPKTAAPSAAVQGSLPEKTTPEKARCNFTSTPPGADITLDGKYVGNTPSEIEISAGTHVVAFSMRGFTEWKRDLTALPGSELTVSAVLQKLE